MGLVKGPEGNVPGIADSAALEGIGLPFDWGEPAGGVLLSGFEHGYEVSLIWVRDIFLAKVAGQYEGAIADSDPVGVIWHGVEAKLEGQVYIHAVPIFPLAEQFDVGARITWCRNLTPVDADTQLPGLEPLWIADFELQVNRLLATEHEAGFLLLGKAGFLTDD